ncbi:MAG: DUF192 domain-containing protein [Kofleriaceae bacterium]
MRASLVALLVVACACGDDRAPGQVPAPTTAPASASHPAPAAPTAGGTVYLTGSDGEVAVTVEVVDTEPTIRQGLMYRRFLAPDAGMLFVPRVEQVWTFWMRNTLIPLDMIFITRDLTVAGVVARTVPLDETPRYVDTPSLYILEVNGGWAEAHGVGAGAKVRFDGIAAVTR